MKRLLAWALAVCALGGMLQPRGAEAAGRRLSVELALVAGDARMLADPAIPRRRREALSARIRSSLGSLAMTARYSAQAAGGTDGRLLSGVQSLRTLFAAGDLPAFSRQADRLTAAYPLDIAYFEPLTVTPLRLETGRSLYHRYCRGCHAAFDPGAASPAPDLFSLARTEPRPEFLARLLGGIHGDRMTSLENPFSDEALASLAAYFVKGDPGASKKQ